MPDGQTAAGAGGGVTAKAPTDLRELRSRLRRCEEELAGVDRVLDELGVDTHSQAGGRYRTMGRARRLAREVGRLRKVERVAKAERGDV